MAKGKKTGGRQPGSGNKVTSEIKELAQQYGPAIIERLAHLAGLHGSLGSGSDSDVTKLGAMRELLDRGYGKAAQAITGGDGKPFQVIVTGVRRSLDEKARG